LAQAPQLSRARWGELFVYLTWKHSCNNGSEQSHLQQ